MKHSPAGPNLLLGWVGGSDPPHCIVPLSFAIHQ